MNAAGWRGLADGPGSEQEIKEVGGGENEGWNTVQKINSRRKCKNRQQNEGSHSEKLMISEK